MSLDRPTGNDDGILFVRMVLIDIASSINRDLEGQH